MIRITLSIRRVPVNKARLLNYSVSYYLRAIKPRIGGVFSFQGATGRRCAGGAVLCPGGWEGLGDLREKEAAAAAVVLEDADTGAAGDKFFAQGGVHGGVDAVGDKDKVDGLAGKERAGDIGVGAANSVPGGLLIIVQQAKHDLEDIGIFPHDQDIQGMCSISGGHRQMLYIGSKVTIMRKEFRQKVVWITGASSGIGEALAYAFSAAGARVILSSRRREELERVRQACVDPAQVRVLALDLVDIPALAGKVAEATAAFGGIDILVHNGGVSQRSLVAETGLEVQRRVMEVDYFSYVALTQAVLPHFLERGTGQFVVMSSVMGKIGTPMRSAYAAAKHALHGFFDCLRAEVSPRNIRVTILTPGYIRTNIAGNAVTRDGSPMGGSSVHIEQGLPADKAAAQILRAVAAERYEAFVGRNGLERLALLLNRLAPGVVVRMAPKMAPK